MNGFRLRTMLFMVMCFLLIALFIATCDNAKLLIDESNRPIIEEALSKFDPGMREYLASIPVFYGNVRTARAQTTYYTKPGREHILVSRDWDKKYGESRHWKRYYKYYDVSPEAPAFSRPFKLKLLVHEYLHHAEAKKNSDIQVFSNKVHEWYLDPSWGEPLSDHNYQKYTLFWNLYRPESLSSPSKRGPGEQEFAYIGEQIASDSKKRLEELPSQIIEYYRGILREDLLVQKTPLKNK